MDLFGRIIGVAALLFIGLMFGSALINFQFN